MHAEPHLAAVAPLPAYLDYLLAVAHLPMGDTRPLSLRLHLPGFAAEAHPAAALDTYLAYLKRETTMHAVLFAGTSRVRQLSFEGAGAAWLPERGLDALLAHLRRHFRFMDGDAADYEAAVDAAAVPPGSLRRLRERGFHRIRIDFDGSGEGPQRLPVLVDGARAAGFRSVGVALACDLRGQTLHRLRWMLEVLVGAAPDRIVLCRRAGWPAPDVAAGSVARRMQLCADRLQMASYTHAGGVQYARLPGGAVPAHGTMHLVGCGAGAMSTVGAVACRNVTALYDYYRLLDRNELPVA